MKIATWNIGGGFISPMGNLIFDTENINYFVKKIKKSKAEIVGLQEIHKSEGNNQIEQIAKTLGFKYFEIVEIADSHIKKGEKLCIGIISKFPIKKIKFHKLINPKLEAIIDGKQLISHDKGFLEIDVNYENKEIKILSGHMVPFKKFNKDFLSGEFEDIIHQIEEIILNFDKPLVILADMNFENIENLLPNIFKRGFTQVLNFNKFTTPKQTKIDKIIISKDFLCKKSEIFKGKADHYLCSADIELI